MAVNVLLTSITNFYREIPESYLLWPIVLVIVILLIAYEFIDEKCSQKTKNILILIISAGLIIFLDLYSFIILTLISTSVYILVKRRVKLNPVLLPLVISLIFLLILLKNHYLFLDAERPYIPLGISYYFFRLISFVVDYSTRKPDYSQVDPLTFYLYVYFFPIFLAGPIQRFGDFNPIPLEERQNKKHNYYLMFAGVLVLKLSLVDFLLFKLFITGLREGILLDIQQYGWINRILIFWGHGFVCFIHGYLDLMLYTELSKSAARILGYSCVDNFNRPLLATNISMFWQRWHMSLSNWTRDYVFFPTLIKTRKTWVANYLSMLTIGIWHSITLNWIFWALAHGTALNVYDRFRRSALYRRSAGVAITRKFMAILGCIVTISFVALVYNFVAFKDSSQAFGLLFQLFGP